VVVVALDTSHPTGSVSVARDDDVAATVTFGDGASHLAGIGPAAGDALERAGMTLDDVDRVALTIGPGSFTGLRIGLAFAKGLVAARGFELAIVSTLELLALPHLSWGGVVCSMIDARRNEVYAGLFRLDEGGAPGQMASLIEPCALPAAELARVVGERASAPVRFTGTGAVRYRDIVGQIVDAVVDDDNAFPSTAALAAIAAHIEPVAALEVPGLEPAYLRPSGAERKRLRPIDP